MWVVPMVIDMGTKKGQRRKTARRAYEPTKSDRAMRRATIATDNMSLARLKAEVRKYFRLGGK